MLQNLWGTSFENGSVVVRRVVEDKSIVLSDSEVKRLLNNVESNVLLLKSLSLYLNNGFMSGIADDIRDWSRYKPKYKYLICYLLGMTNRLYVITNIYRNSSVVEKEELFSIILSLIGILNIELSFLSTTIENSQLLLNIENTPNLTSNNSIEEEGKNEGDFSSDSSSHFYEKVENITVVEKQFGNYHISANEQFYINLKIVVESTELYRGRIAWSKVLETLKNDVRYSAITDEYLKTSGYKLNTNNLRNWYNYYKNKDLKTDKFKVISDSNSITNIISEIKHNTRMD